MGAGAKPNISGARANGEPPPQSLPLGRGVETLLKGNNPVGESKGGDPTDGGLPRVDRGRAIIPSWYFYAADFALLGVVSWVAFWSGKPLTAWSMVFCVLAVFLGAGFALFPLLASAPGGPWETGRTRVPKWVFEGSGDPHGEHQGWVVHLQDPMFVAEVTRRHGAVEITPVWPETGNLFREAAWSRLREEALEHLLSSLQGSSRV